MKSAALPLLSAPAVASMMAFGRVAVAASLCMMLVEQPLLAERATKKTATAAAPAQMQPQDRVLHALNRFTFGPRPGDAAAVQAIGLGKWFEMQLNPSAIDDSVLETRLAEYPAMKLSLAELQRKFPGPQMLKAIIEGRQPMPTDPVQRAMVETQTRFYKLQQKQLAKAALPAGAAAPAMDGSGDMAMGAPAAQMATGQMAPDKALPASALAPDSAVPDAAVTPEDRQALRQQATNLAEIAPDERFKAIMVMSPNELQRLRASLGTDGVRLLAGFTPEQKEMLVALPGGNRMVALEAMESRVMRDLYSERQLEAVMTDFWLNHFNVYVRKNQNEPYLLPSYERETIRPRALGNFEDLLIATAKSPAMLVYLDNFRSIGPDSLQASRIGKFARSRPDAPILQVAGSGLNENYGRELMELHTLGVNGGYTQSDVTMVAKVFTGWGLDRPYQSGDYRFDERRHEPGSKVVLGKTINEAGEKEGLEVLHMFATNPATAHFISQKLAVRFVSDVPPAALVDRMSASFLKSNGDIKSVLRTMFDSPEFWSRDVLHAKVKTPEEFVFSAIRACGAQVINPPSIVQALDKLGMPLYGMQTPNGYSWTQENWVGTGALVSRMNFSLTLSANRLPGIRTDWTRLLGEPSAAVVPASYSSADTVAISPALIAREKRLEQILLGQSVSDRTRATVLSQSADGNVTDQAAAQFDLGGSGKRNYVPRSARGAGNMPSTPDDAQAAIMAGLLLGSPEFQRR